MSSKWEDSSLQVAPFHPPKLLYFKTGKDGSIFFQSFGRVRFFSPPPLEFYCPVELRPIETFNKTGMGVEDGMAEAFRPPSPSPLDL